LKIISFLCAFVALWLNCCLFPFRNGVDKAFPPFYSESENLDKGGDNIQMKGKKGSQS
jgi:hypothetical protein